MTSSSPRQSEIRQFDSVSLADVFSTFTARWFSILLTGMILLPMLIGCILLIPKKFDSQAQLLVRLGRGSVSVDPTTELSNSVAIQESRIAQVNSVRELLGSRAVTEAVAKKVGSDRILEKHSTLERLIASATAVLPSSVPSPVGEMSGKQVGEQIELEEAILAVAKSLTIATEKDAYTISLRVRTGSSFLSRDILAAVVDCYQDHHIKAFKNNGAEGFFEGQTTQAYQRVTEAQEKLNALKSESKVADIGSALAALRSTISQIRNEQLNVESELFATESEIRQLKTEIGATPKQIDTEVKRGITKKLGDDMRQSLYNLEMQYKDMQAKLSPNNPKLRTMEEQIAEARKIADSETGELPQTVQGINSVHQQLEIALRTAEVRKSGLQSKQEKIETQLTALESELVAMNEVDVQMTRAKWEFELAETNYLQFARRLDEANQVASLDKQRLSEISVTQDATLNLKRTSPKRSILGILAVAVAGLLALAQAILRGKPNSNQAAAADVEDFATSSKGEVGSEMNSENKGHEDWHRGQLAAVSMTSETNGVAVERMPK